MGQGERRLLSVGSVERNSVQRLAGRRFEPRLFDQQSRCRILQSSWCNPDPLSTAMTPTTIAS